jgi:uncharacterized protein (DUF2164 family)
MAHRFKKHYTREEAQALLPQIRQWLERLNELRQQLEKVEARRLVDERRRRRRR